MIDTPHFTLISYNICGVNNPTRVAELSLFLSRHQPSVVVLQEPKHNHLTKFKQKGKTITRTPKALPRFTNYTSCYFTHPTKPTGIVMYIHTSCTYMTLPHIPHCTPYRPALTRTVAGFLWVSSPLLPCPIIIGGVYLYEAANECDVAALAEHAALASSPLPSSVSSSPIPVFLVGELIHITHSGIRNPVIHIARMKRTGVNISINAS